MPFKFAPPPPPRHSARNRLPGVRRIAALALVLAASAAAALFLRADSAYADEPAATAIAITSDAGTDKQYATGDAITVRLTFPQTVHSVAGASLSVQIGENERAATTADCSSGCGTTLDFSYTPIAADYDANGVSVAADALSATTLSHRHGADPAHAFSLALPDTLARPQADHRVNLGDYDQDDDGLIEISTLDHLNAVRYDLDGDGGVSAADAANYAAAFLSRDADMGCPTTTGDADNNDCVGYELAENLDFDTDGDGDVDSADDYPNWTPIGTTFAARFDGNLKTISNMKIRDSRNFASLGLFAITSGTVTGVGLVNADISTSGGAVSVGALAGVNSGTIRYSYAAGVVEAAGIGSNNAGGLAGYNTGTLAANWSRISVSSSGTAACIGGLLGRTVGVTIAANYAAGAVKAAAAGNNVGGLTGGSQSATITASYAAGPVSTSGTARVIGGLYGEATGSNAITAAYWYVGTTGIADDSDSAMPEGRTTRELQSATSASGVFADWDDLTVDASGTNDDDPWDFGGIHEYPVLSFGGLAPAAQRGEARILADNWDFPVAGELIRAWLPGGPSLRAVKETTGNGCPAAGATVWKQPWIWQYSTDGGLTGTDEADTDAARGAGCTYLFIPQSGDAGRIYRARVALAAGGHATTAALGKVKASSDAAALSWASGHAAPSVGTAITASGVPSGAALVGRWRWQRCDDNAATPSGCELVGGGGSGSYRPVSADVNHYIRAYIHCQTAGGV